MTIKEPQGAGIVACSFCYRCLGNGKLTISWCSGTSDDTSNDFKRTIERSDCRCPICDRTECPMAEYHFNECDGEPSPKPRGVVAHSIHIPAGVLGPDDTLRLDKGIWDLPPVDVGYYEIDLPKEPK